MTFPIFGQKKLDRKTITIHPGFPKCATSAIQRGFVVRDHALAKAVDVRFLSGQFETNTGYPDVLEAIDQPNRYISTFNQKHFDPGHYFLTNEALFGLPREPFREKFDAIKWIVSTRDPLMQIVSNYRFSGWTKSSFHTLIHNKQFGIEGTLKRQFAKVKDLPAPGETVVVFPIDEIVNDLLPRFCKAAFGVAPKLAFALEQAQNPIVNPSISFALAHELHVLIEKNCTALSTEEKRRIVAAARQTSLPPDLQRLVPHGVADLIRERTDLSIEGYCEILSAGEMTNDVGSVCTAARSRAAALIASPAPTISQRETLCHLAEKILSTCLD